MYRTRFLSIVVSKTAQRNVLFVNQHPLSHPVRPVCEMIAPDVGMRPADAVG